MKTLKTIAIAFLFFTISANAQITKGNWMVGGSANFNSTSYESTSNGGSSSEGKGIGVTIYPTFGYFIADKLALGLSPSFGYSKTEGGNAYTSYGAGPFVRYYLLKPEKMINVLTHIGYSYGTDNSNSTSNILNFKAGPAIFLNSSVALELTLSYNISQLTSDSSSATYKSFNIGFGFQIHLEKEK